MCRNKTVKKATALMTSFILASFLMFGTCVSASELISADKISGDQISYTTETVSYGSMVSEITSGANLYYPKYTPVIYKGPDVIVTATSKSIGSTVKAGDPIISVQPQISDVDVEEKRISLEREKESYASGLSQRQENIQELFKARDNISDGTEYSKMTIKIQIAQLQLEQFILTEEETIASLQADYDKLLEDLKVEYIYAPADGVVSFPGGILTEGMKITSGQKICTINDMNVGMITIDRQLNYGQKVTIEVSTRTVESVEGTVVYVGSYSIIAPDKGSLPSNISAARGNGSTRLHYRTLDLDNVLVVSPKAVTRENLKSYVTILDENNVTHTRQIKEGAASGDGVWVTNGLSEGDRVVLK